MESKQKKDNDAGSWVLIVFLFAINAWPVALVLLLIKLFGSDEKKTTAMPQASGSQPTQTASAARPAKAKKAAKKVVKSPLVRDSTAKRLTVFGAFLAVIGAWMALNGPIDALFWAGADWNGFYLWELLQYLAVSAGGVAMLCSGRSMARALKRYGRYLSIFGDQDAMSVRQLADTLGYAPRRVEKDLQKMIDKGYFGGRAYLNVELGYIFRSGQAQADATAQAEKAKQTADVPEETEQGYSGILRDIRRVNDRIADPVLSAKIDRLEAVVAKIFKAVEEDPKKRVRINTLLDYYLPTTQKLLNAYAEFEGTGVDGENLRQAKGRIESTMDAIVAGFEHQLDELYRADVLDVDSDIRVMETMLRRDTASAERDFELGTAAQAEEAGG